MKTKISPARIIRTVFLLSLIFFACFTSVEAQGVIPRICMENSYQTGTVTLAADAPAGKNNISVNATVPEMVALVINPGGQNEERIPYVAKSDTGNQLFLSTNFTNAFREGGGGERKLAFNHSAGETITFAGYQTIAYFGYHNTNTSNVTIPRSFGTKNYFFPGPSTYPGQPAQFLPGIHDNVFSFNYGGQGLPSEIFNWVLGDMMVTASVGNQGQGCGTITYQGKLNDAGNPANGQYDLQFRAYDSLTEGTPQSDNVTVENATVTNGVFTVQLNFASSFTNNDNARFLEIAVRAGDSTGAFTTLMLRQPITSVPYAVSAQTAASSTNAVNATNADKLGNVAANQYVLTTDPRLSAANGTNFIQNSTTPQVNANFNISGNGAIGGNLAVSGTINGTVTNATNAANATNATNAANADKLGNIAANQYLTTTAAGTNFIQNTTTQQTGNFNISGNGAIGGNLNVSGAITSSCRTGFTAIAGGRLCVSAMQSPAVFVVAVEGCRNMSARVGNSADVMLTFSQTGFNYFGDLSQGWLADHMGERLWGTWDISFPNADFDGPPAANGIGGVGPQLPYRCVY